MTLSAKEFYKIIIGVIIVYCIFTMYNTILDSFEIKRKNQQSIVIKDSLECGKFPDTQELNTNSDWQVFRAANTLWFLYGAYYDDRDAVQPLPVVRILLMVNNSDLSDKAFCQLWYENHEKPFITKVLTIDLLWTSFWGKNKNGFTPYLVLCENPFKNIPKYVSIVEEKCDEAFNLLKIFHEPKAEIKKNFVVCVKNMNFTNDISSRLIEWLEIVKILKAEKVFVYVASVHPEVMNLLKFYESQGFVEINYIKYPKMVVEDFNLLQLYHTEMIPYQDCFYKIFNTFNYIVPIDIDEIIMPLNSKDLSWTDLIKRIIAIDPKNGFLDSYQARNIHFYCIDEYLMKIHPDRKIFHFLNNTLRIPDYFDVGMGTKSLISTRRTLVVHNHSPIKCLTKFQYCDNYQIELKDGQLSHYRKTCNRDLDSEDCKKDDIDKAVNDTSLTKFKTEIIKNVMKAFDNFDDYRNNLV